MRVIAGKYKGKRLFSPPDNRVRPTTDRIKETVFNILQSKGALRGLALDLFCGSGALGIEALSRGCEKCIFTDKDRDSVALTKKNLEGIEEPHEVYRVDYAVAIERFTTPFSLVLIDPPYNDGLECDAVLRLYKRRLLTPESVIFVEQKRENSLINLSSSFIIDTRTCGNTRISFCCLKEDHA